MRITGKGNGCFTVWNSYVENYKQEHAATLATILLLR